MHRRTVALEYRVASPLISNCIDLIPSPAVRRACRVAQRLSTEFSTASRHAYADLTVKRCHRYNGYGRPGNFIDDRRTRSGNEGRCSDMPMKGRLPIPPQHGGAVWLVVSAPAYNKVFQLSYAHIYKVAEYVA